MDVALAIAANHLGRGVIDPLTSMLCAVPLLLAVWTALAGAALWRSRDRKALGAALFTAFVLHFLVNEALLKHALGALIPLRVRPYLAHPESIVPIGYPFTDSSFPSSHAASTAAVATVLCAAYPRLAPIGVACVVAMDFARVHNGMHYPSDVLVGTALGVGYGLAGVVVGRWLTAARPRSPAASPTPDRTGTTA
jgi:membrane-associated phospholipid phosphatase